MLPGAQRVALGAAIGALLNLALDEVLRPTIIAAGAVDSLSRIIRCSNASAEAVGRVTKADSGRWLQGSDPSAHGLVHGGAVISAGSVLALSCQCIFHLAMSEQCRGALHDAGIVEALSSLLRRCQHGHTVAHALGALALMARAPPAVAGATAAGASNAISFSKVREAVLRSGAARVAADLSAWSWDKAVLGNAALCLYHLCVYATSKEAHVQSEASRDKAQARAEAQNPGASTGDARSGDGALSDSVDVLLRENTPAALATLLNRAAQMNSAGGMVVTSNASVGAERQAQGPGIGDQMHSGGSSAAGNVPQCLPWGTA